MLAAVCAAQPPAAAPWRPTDSVQAAATDLASLPLSQRRRTRYLDLGNVPEKERVKLAAVLSGHVNGLSREPEIVIPPLVGGLVLRVNLDDYGWDTAVWDRLNSPYQHVTVETVVTEWWPGGTWHRDGRHYAAGSFRYKRKVRQTALAPWLSEGPGKAALAYLVAATRSPAPLVSGQWFLWQTAVQEGRGNTGYYDFLGVKNLKEFQRLVRFNAATARDLEQRRVVVFSGVAQEPRRLERTPTVLGGYWSSFDSVAAIDKKNPLNVLDGDLKFDAAEILAPLPNGSLASFLTNGAGVRQNTAPPNIVAGDRTSSKDSQLHVGLSCIRCHMAGKAAGILDMDAARITKLGSVDYRKLRELRRQYQRQIEPLMDQDRAGYRAAVKAATGMEIAQYGVEYSRWYIRHDEARVDLAWAARDVGVTPGRLRAALVGYGDTLLPTLSLVANGGVIPVRQWEESLPVIHTILKGSRP